MRIVSVNAGRSELMRIGARTVETGIRKGAEFVMPTMK